VSTDELTGVQALECRHPGRLLAARFPRSFQQGSSASRTFRSSSRASRNSRVGSPARGVTP